MAHCGTCHETFSVVRNFDKHRKAGMCLEPAGLGMVQNAYGTWRLPDERDVSMLSTQGRSHE